MENCWEVPVKKEGWRALTPFALITVEFSIPARKVELAISKL